MTYHFKNLVFEGGGVKGMGYVGAMEVLEQKEILPQIERAGGTSAGAINALLFALGISIQEQKEILSGLDFKKFMDDSFGVFRDVDRLLNRFGWNKGDFFFRWIGKFIKEKLGDPYATFQDLKAAGKPGLYVYGTNLSTRYGEVFSYDHTPTMRIADAVRISMSIPLFFAAVRNARNDVYVDGGVLNNYPVKLFDREKYIESERQARMARKTEYYEKENGCFLQRHPERSPYCYNRETLGLRLDSHQEIAVFRYGAVPQHYEIDDIFEYSLALIHTIMNSQQNLHLHSDDWQRTIYIDTLGVSTTDFDITPAMKEKLSESGRKGAERYFAWYDAPETEAANKPSNKP